MRWPLAVFFVCCMAEATLAHTVVPGLEGFPGGLLHPVLVPAQAMSLVVLGLLIGQQRRAYRFALLAGFAGALLVATALVAAAVAPTDPESVLIACGGIAGLLVAIGRPLPIPLSAVPVLMGGAMLLLDSVPSVPSVRETLLSLAGTALAACLLLVLIAGNTMEPKRAWLRIGIRVVGSWVAAASALVLTLRFAA